MYFNHIVNKNGLTGNNRRRENNNTSRMDNPKHEMYFFSIVLADC